MSGQIDPKEVRLAFDRWFQAHAGNTFAKLVQDATSKEIADTLRESIPGIASKTIGDAFGGLQAAVASRFEAALNDGELGLGIPVNGIPVTVHLIDDFERP